MLLGNILMVPVGNSIIYVRPLYVESTGNPQPELRFVITVLGQNVQIQPSISESLAALLKVPVVPGSEGSTSGTSSSLASALAAQVNSLLSQAQTDYTAAQTALKNGGSTALAQYQADVDAMNGLIQEAESLLTPATGSSTSTTTTTTTPKTTTTTPKNKAKPKPSSTA